MQPSPTIRSGPSTAFTIVVADNAHEVRELMARWLEEAGYSVISVGSGNDAIHAIRCNEVHLVVTEVIMPGGDGLEVIMETRRHPVPPRVIAVSGGGQFLPATDCLRVAKSLGAHVTLGKPFTRDEFEAAVAHAIGSEMLRMT